MTVSLLLPPLGSSPTSSLVSADDCSGGPVFVWLPLCYSGTSVPPEELCTFLGSPWSSSITSALEMFCGGFPDAVTTYSLHLTDRLHFSNCYLCFQTSNFHSTHLKTTATYTMWPNLGAVSFHH